MTEAEVAWAAGLMEGEGCFSVVTQRQTHNGKEYEYLYPDVSMASTDEETIARFTKVVGAGRVYGPYPRPGKDVWWWKTRRPDEVIRVCEMLYPWMGTRRREAMDKVMRLARDKMA